MSRVGKDAARVRHAAEREHKGIATPEDRRRSDSESAAAHPGLTDTKLRRGHPTRDDKGDTKPRGPEDTA